MSKQEDAEALVDALKKKQYAAFAANTPGDKLFHVQVGPFSDIKEAEGARGKLVKRWVQSDFEEVESRRRTSGLQISADCQISGLLERSGLSRDLTICDRNLTSTLPAESLFFPRVSVHVVAVLFPESWRVVVEKFQSA